MPSARAPSLALAALLLVPLLPHGAAGASAPLARVAVIDTGIRADHPEFDAGQVVAWWDFTPERKPASHVDPSWLGAHADQHWDPDVAPFDMNGHGTATASLAAGHDRGACGGAAKLSFDPGAPLIVAKVAQTSTSPGLSNASITGSISRAIEWAVDQGATVVSISIGTIAPVPLREDGAAFQYAYAHGAMVVVAAGNGLADTGLAPFPAWSTSYGNDPNALVVGGAGPTGATLLSTTGNLDPDVVSWSDDVCVATLSGGYTVESGTSFSTPLVAGMAARAADEATAHGVACRGAALQRILLLSAGDSAFSPYAREGMGVLLGPQLPGVLAHAATCDAAAAQADYDAQGAWAPLDRQYHDGPVELLKTAQLA